MKLTSYYASHERYGFNIQFEKRLVEQSLSYVYNTHVRDRTRDDF